MKEFVWDLSVLFKNYEDFYIVIKNIKRQLLKISDYKEVDLGADNLLEILDLKWHLKQMANNVLIYASLNYYEDINSKETILMKTKAEQLLNDVDFSLGFIDEKIIEIGKEKIKLFIGANEGLEKYKQYFDNLFRKCEHIQSEMINREIEKRKNNINEFLTRYNNIISSINYGLIIVDGKEVELKQSNIAKYSSSRDRVTRRDTYMAINGAFIDAAQELSGLLHSIYDNRVNICKLEKYDSVLDKALFEENIDSMILDNLIESVHSNLPLMQDYLNLKVKYLNILEPHLYDYSVPVDNNEKRKYTLSMAMEIIKEALKPLGEKYLNIVNYLIDNGHIDAILNEKRHQSITFSWDVYSFLNYKEAYIDLKNLIHELGHIVNAHLSKSQPFIYEDSTVFVGETASLVNEILLNRYLYDMATSEAERLYYLSLNIENYFVQVFKQTMYTEFENVLYKEVFDDREFDCDFLNEKYMELIKLYYGDSTMYDDCSKVEWTRLGHLFRWNYYVYKYATGLIIAGNVVNLLVDKKILTQEKYLEFLSMGSSEYSLDLLNNIGIDLTNSKVIDESFSVLKKDIENFKKLIYYG